MNGRSGYRSRITLSIFLLIPLMQAVDLKGSDFEKR
jgi:hypothetical protein